MAKTTYSQNLNRRKNKKKILTALIVIILVASIVMIVLENTGRTTIFIKDASPKDSKTAAKTTSKQPTAQEDYSGGNERNPDTPNREDKGSSVIIDDNGNIPREIDKSQPIVSSSGEITLYSPAKNSSIKNGQNIAGSSTLPKITYRVIDDISGMIAMGELSVINGNFSGNIEFKTTAKTGRIDVFATREDGSEYSNIEVPINFK